MYEEETDDSASRLPLKVSTRSESGSQIDYPAYIYVFDAENGSYVDDCLANKSDEVFDLGLAPGEYVVVAIAGIGEDYVIPQNPKLEDVITMKNGNCSSRAMMMGRSRVTIKNDTQTSLDIMLYYAVASVEVSLSDIPLSTKEVTFSLSPLYSTINFSGNYSGAGKEVQIDCTKRDDDIWRTAPFYIYPGSGAQTSFSITLKDGGRENTYAYTFNGTPKAKVPLKINGSYRGQITIGGNLTVEGWEETEEVSFEFGPQAGKENDGVDNNQSGYAELPEVGDIIENSIVVAIEKIEEGGHDVLMMNLNEWTTNEAGAEALLEQIRTDSWELPLKYEVNLLKSNFGGENLSSINTMITAVSQDYPLIKAGEERYLCENNNYLRSFSFKSGGTISKLGSDKIYRIRLIRWVHYDTE